MCGRYTLTAKQEKLARKFLLKHLDEADHKVAQPRFNIAPSQEVLAIRNSRLRGERISTAFRWGLIPFWAKDEKIGYRMINARSETAAIKPAFRHALRHRRCLLPASGFYEWKREGKYKQPFYFTLKSGDILAMAGMYERWNSPDDTTVESCTILTTGPNAVMEPIHNRMPVILAEKDWERWLNPEVIDADAVIPLLKPHDPDQMRAYPVTTMVNSARNDDPILIQPIDLDFGLFPGEGESDLFSGL